MFVLKILPLLISVYVTFLITLSHYKKNSLIVKYAKRFSKQDLSEEEIAYIKSATFFWIIVSLTNVVLHVVVLLSSHKYYWVFYTSIGWYFVFGIAGALQYLHRKFVFVKRPESA